MPINVIPHYLPIGQLMGIIWREGGGGGGGGMTEDNAPIVGCIVEVKSKFPCSHIPSFSRGFDYRVLPHYRGH